MDMGHDMGGSDMEMPKCVISMLWNWNTIDSCFLASSWHITSKGMFAGSCIGVICLTIALEFLRRLAREYDAFVIRRARMRPLLLSAPITHKDSNKNNDDDDNNNNDNTPPASSPSTPGLMKVAGQEEGCRPQLRIRPRVSEQFIRALLHLFQFAVAYFIMLLAMYFNGYIIISIFIGAFLGSLIFSWEVLGGNESR